MAMGRRSDKKIKNCGLYKLLEQEDSVMADRGFLIDDDLRELGVKFPNFSSVLGSTGEHAFLRDNTKRLWTKQLWNSPKPFCEACVTCMQAGMELPTIKSQDTGCSSNESAPSAPMPDGDSCVGESFNGGLVLTVQVVHKSCGDTPECPTVLPKLGMSAPPRP